MARAVACEAYSGARFAFVVLLQDTLGVVMSRAVEVTGLGHVTFHGREGRWSGGRWLVNGSLVVHLGDDGIEVGGREHEGLDMVGHLLGCLSEQAGNEETINELGGQLII